MDRNGARPRRGLREWTPPCFALIVQRMCSAARRPKVVLYDPRAVFLHDASRARGRRLFHVDPRRYDVRVIDGRLEDESIDVPPRMPRRVERRRQRPGAGGGGFELPWTLAEWSRFDFIGSAGPWVSETLFLRVERFKFYQRAAWARPGWIRQAVQRAARWRLAHGRYGFPVEKAVARWLRSPHELS